MAILPDLGVNLLADSIWLGVGAGVPLAARAIQHRIRRSRALRFWNPTCLDDVYIVFGDRPQLRNADPDQDGAFVQEHDAYAVADLRLVLSRVYKHVEIITDDIAIAKENVAIVSIGGPIANKFSHKLFREISPPWQFEVNQGQANAPRAIAHCGNTRDKRYVTKRAPEGAIQEDFGILVRCMRNGAAGTKMVPAFILAGNYGIGTWGTASYFANRRNVPSVELDKPLLQWVTEVSPNGGMKPTTRLCVVPPLT
ncbi:MAG TPA: hypothetical protein VF624_00365 [Tepidisphaeraceae bacterium]|jgi:hypothetical protein